MTRILVVVALALATVLAARDVRSDGGIDAAVLTRYLAAVGGDLAAAE